MTKRSSPPGHGRAGAAVLERERRQVDAGRPALGPLGELVELLRLELDAQPPHQPLGLAPCERKLLAPHLEETASRTQAGDRPSWKRASGQGDGGAVRHVKREGGYDVGTALLADEVRPVQSKDNRMPERDEGGEQLALRYGRAPACADRREHGPLERPGPVERRRDAHAQPANVVLRVARDPGERTVVPLRPLRQHGCLSVPRRRDQRDDRAGRGRPQPVDERRPRDAGVRRRRDLALDRVETSAPVRRRGRASARPSSHRRDPLAPRRSRQGRVH